MQLELLRLHGASQRALERQLLHGVRVHLGRIELEQIASLRLGAVHGDVGVLHQRLTRLAVLGEHCDAHAGRHEQLAPVDLHRHADGLAHFLRDVYRVLDAVDVGRQHHELVATHARHGIGFAQRALHARGHRLEHLVAHGVAEGVVDDLEAVEVDEVHREPAPVATRLIDGERQVIQEQLAIRQTRERIVEGELRDLLRRGLRLGVLLLEQPDDDAESHGEDEDEVEEAGVQGVVRLLDGRAVGHRDPEEVQLERAVEREGRAHEQPAQSAARALAASHRDADGCEHKRDADDAAADRHANREARAEWIGVVGEEQRHHEADHGRRGEDRGAMLVVRFRPVRGDQLRRPEDHPHNGDVRRHGRHEGNRQARECRGAGDLGVGERDREPRAEEHDAHRRPRARPMNQEGLAIGAREKAEEHGGEQCAGSLNDVRSEEG